MKIMSRHFRAIAMKTVEEQYWTDRKQDTRLPIHRLMQKRLRLKAERLTGHVMQMMPAQRIKQRIFIK